MKLITITLLFVLTGCSSLMNSNNTLPIENVTEKMCNTKLMRGNTYLSKFENNAIYLFVGENKDKCLLRKL